MLLSSGARRSRAQAQAGHAEHQRQGLRRAMRNFEALVGELEHGSRAVEGEEGFEAMEEDGPSAPSPHGQSANSMSQHYGDGKGIERRTIWCWASLSALSLYFKLRTEVGVPWLMVLAPPWVGGILYLFKASIPRMLASVEGALGAQHSRDRERISQMDFYRMRLGQRDWDQVERGCCACGLWGHAVIQTTLALSAAFYLGFLMIVALELDINFIRPDSLWEVLVPILLALVFFWIASVTALCNLLEGGSQMFDDSFDAKTWAYLVLLGTSGLFSTSLLMKELAQIGPPLPNTNSSAPHSFSPQEATKDLETEGLVLALVPVAVISALPIPYFLWKGLRAESSVLRGQGFEMQTFSSEGSNHREGDDAGLLRIVDRPTSLLWRCGERMPCHSPHLRNGVVGILILFAELFAIEALRGPRAEGLAAEGLKANPQSLSPFVDLTFFAVLLALAVWGNFGAAEARRVERPPRRARTPPSPSNPDQSPGSRSSGERERSSSQPLNNSSSTLSHNLLEVQYLMETGLSQREAEGLVRERQSNRQFIVEEAERLSHETVHETSQHLAPAPPEHMATEEKDEGPSVKTILEEAGIQVPPEYICPITMEIMKDPVILTDGHVYERSAIERWLISHSTSPKTNQVIERDKLIPCHTVRAIINEFIDSALNSIQSSQSETKVDAAES